LRRKNLKDDFESDENSIRQQAEEEAIAILDLLLPPPSPLSKKKRLLRVVAVLKDTQLSGSDRLEPVQKLAKEPWKEYAESCASSKLHSTEKLESSPMS
jgi:hypothetical protein